MHIVRNLINFNIKKLQIVHDSKNKQQLKLKNQLGHISIYTQKAAIGHEAQIQCIVMAQP